MRSTLLVLASAGAMGFAALPAAAQNATNSGAATGKMHDAEMHQAMQTMHENMMKANTGDPDKDFAMMMIPHHQGAIDMAKSYLKKGKDAKLREMAETIIKAQEKEIAEMKDRLSDLEKKGKTE